MGKAPPATGKREVDEYIATFPREVQIKLVALREAIREEAPEAKEVMSYGMPAFKGRLMLVYYAAFKNHIGFFPTPSGMTAFRDELSGFKQSKSGVQFPLDQDIPLGIVRRMVRFRLSEDGAKPR